MATDTLGPEVLTVEKVVALARALNEGAPIDNKTLAAALIDIADALGVLLHVAQHVFQVANPDCDGPSDCPMRTNDGAHA